MINNLQTLTEIDKFRTESLLIELPVYDGDGERRNVFDDDISWYLFNKKAHKNSTKAILSLEDDGVELEKVDAANGEVEIRIDRDITDFSGEYWQRIVVDGPGNGRQIAVGKVNIY